MAYNAERRRNLGLALKAARQRANFSASHASQIISANGIKCSRGTLLAWERGIGRTSREPFASDLAVIARVYGCEVDDFFKKVHPDAEADLKVNVHAPHDVSVIPVGKMQSSSGDSPASGVPKAMAGSNAFSQKATINPDGPPSAD